MPLPLLIALFVAFGLAKPGDASEAALPMSEAEAFSRAAQALVGVLLVGGFAFGVGRGAAWRVARVGRATTRVRRAYSLGVRAADFLSLGVYAWIIHGLQWPAVIRSGFGLGNLILIDNALILLPFLLAQLSCWWGVYAAEHLLVPGGGAVGLGRYLVIKARMSLGMVLPVATLYVLGTELVHRAWPESLRSPWDQPFSLAFMGVIVLLLAPAFVRIAWPTRPLPPGPLRDRLEHLAKRAGFRCTDILVWDTNKVIVNAGVTGSLPWFRYVLLTDALLETLSPHEIAAVFGHEIGHVAHRHLAYFGFFVVGSLGAMALADPFGAELPGWLNVPDWVLGDSITALLIQAGVLLATVGIYFVGIFGFISRRFERQADIFGCRVVSCGRSDCPPHADIDGQSASEIGPRAGNLPLCPVGIRIFINSLANVAMLNGMRPNAWSWRHGSIAWRIAFLEGLIGRPEAERKFQDGVARLRRTVGLVVLAVVGALAALTSMSGTP